MQDRARQQLATWLEPLSRSPRVREVSDTRFARELVGTVPTEQANLLAQFRGSGVRSFLPALDDLVGTAAAFRRSNPAAAERVVTRAERALEGRFDVLGFSGLSYGTPIDWHLDPLSGRRSPLRHWSRVPYLDAEQVGDHKVIWELNRHQHFVTLGQAYCLTGDERFAAAFVGHTLDWMKANPSKLGINWSSSLEVAFRAMSWTWALHLFRHAAALTPEFFVRVLKFLLIHGHHLATHLSTYFSPNTHLTGEALGLLQLGTAFPQFACADRWREVGWKILERELRRQVRPDGFYFEQSSWYQRYTADFYLHALILLERAGDAVPPATRATIESLVDPLLHLTRPDGTAPLIGDDDGGQLAAFDDAPPGDFRATLALAAAVFERGDCRAVAGDRVEAVAWVLGRAGLEKLRRVNLRTPETARAFRHGGCFIVRSGWDSEADFTQINCGPHGSLRGGHAHADALACEIAVRGRPFLVDPGTFSYAQPERNDFRTTAAHNTLSIDGLPSSVPADRPFRWARTAQGVLHAWYTHERFAYFEGIHDGYHSLDAPAEHERALLYLPARMWVIRDRVASAGVHRVAVHYQASAGLTARRRPNEPAVSLGDESTGGAPWLDIRVEGEEVSVECTHGWVAPAYGVRQPAPRLTFTSVGKGPQELVTFLVPTDRPLSTRVQPLDGHARGAYQIQADGIDGLLFVSADPAAGAHSARVRSDASWVWVQHIPGTGVTSEFVLIDGSSLCVAGEQILSLAQSAAWVHGRRETGGWRIDVGPPRAGASGELYRRR